MNQAFVSSHSLPRSRVRAHTLCTHIAPLRWRRRWIRKHMTSFSKRQQYDQKVLLHALLAVRAGRLGGVGGGEGEGRPRKSRRSMRWWRTCTDFAIRVVFGPQLGFCRFYIFIQIYVVCIHACLYACVYDTCRGHARLSRYQWLLDLTLGSAGSISIYIYTCVSCMCVSVYVHVYMWVCVVDLYMGLCMCVCVCACIYAIEDGRRWGLFLRVESWTHHE